ncbi:MAG: hypothetical protein M0C28_45430 [Candidatus Moduliflexus flocculans]|nr:hypothetical protein [Candidatus Moduliflexus flocculans]
MGAPTRPTGHPEDAVLVRKAQQGDMDAFESLVREYQQRVYALCRRLTGAHQSADDLAQETFIKAYFALARFDAALAPLPLAPEDRRQHGPQLPQDPGPGEVARRRPARDRRAADGRLRPTARRSGSEQAEFQARLDAGGGDPCRRPEERLRPAVPRGPELRGDLPGARPAARHRHVPAQPGPAEAEGPPGRFPRQGSLR